MSTAAFSSQRPHAESGSSPPTERVVRERGGTLQHFGNTCVIEPRYIEAILHGAINDGLRVE